MSRNRLRHLAVGYALGELAREVRELDGNSNYHPRIEEYFLNLDPPVKLFDSDGDGVKESYPYCAAAVQFVTDHVCELYGIVNPLNEVKREAYVQDYYDWAETNGLLIPSTEIDTGDLALYRFGDRPVRWNHVGLVIRPMDGDLFRAWEANTTPPPELREQATDTRVTERDGGGIYRKRRSAASSRVCFARWDLEIFVEDS